MLWSVWVLMFCRAQTRKADKKGKKPTSLQRRNSAGESGSAKERKDAKLDEKRNASFADAAVSSGDGKKRRDSPGSGRCKAGEDKRPRLRSTTLPFLTKTSPEPVAVALQRDVRRAKRNARLDLEGTGRSTVSLRRKCRLTASSWQWTAYQNGRDALTNWS